MKKRFGSILLACAMALTLLPWSVLPARAEGEKQAQPAHANGLYGVAPGDTVYFAKNKNGALAWRVLSLSDDETLPVSKAGQMLLIAEEQMGISGFNPAESGNAWAGSTVQRYCQNNLYKGIIEEWADAPELAAFVKTTVEETSGYSIYGPASLKDEAFFLLSAEEAGTYFKNDEDRIAHNEGGSTHVSWWLRSPVANDSTKAACVDADGRLSSHDITEWWYTTRPAFNLNASNVIYAASATGKYEWPEEFTVIGNNTHAWKLTLLDESRTGFSATVDRTELNAGDAVTVSYSGARTDPDTDPDGAKTEFVSAVLYNGDGEFLGYASLPVRNTGGSEGTVTFTLPLRAGGNCTMRVFNEQRNGYYLSDYAGNVVDIALTVTAKPGASAETACEIGGDTPAEAWENLKTALGEGGTKREDGEDADHPTYLRLTSSCTDGVADNNSYLEAGKHRYIVLDLNGKTLDRGLSNADAAMTNGQVLRVTLSASLTITDSSTNKTGVITGGYGKFGGGIYVSPRDSYDSPRLTLRGGTITGNKASYHGGGVYMDSGRLVLCGGAISENTAVLDGGGVYCNGGACMIESGTISGNTAGGNGGGIRVTQGVENDALLINGGRIIGNKAESGGGVSAFQTFIMNGGEISGNEARYGDGGGVSAAQGGTLNGGKITNNIATKKTEDPYNSSGRGGGIKCGNNGTLTLGGCTVSGNRANEGGGVYAANILIVADGTRIADNSASSGGGVYIRQQQFTMTGGEIVGNEATNGNGGGAYIDDSLFTMTGGRIVGNNARSGRVDDGGGVYYLHDAALNTPAIHVSGSPVITGNVSGGAIENGVLTGGKPSNVLLATLRDPITVIGELADEARIGVSLPNANVGDCPAVAAADYQDGKLTEADVACFKSDNRLYVFTLNDKHQAELKKAAAALAFVSVNEDGDIWATVNAPANTALVAASYDTNGRMLDVKTKFLNEEIDEEQIRINVAAGARYRLMLVDGTTFAPLCEAWDSTLDYS